MRKIIYSLLAVFALLTTSSCSNDDIDNVTTDSYQPMSLEVSLEKAYPLNKENIINFLGEYKNSYIAVTSFIYDESGKLVEECESQLRTFQNVNQKFTKLTKGKYTVITVATYVNNNKIWDFENKEKLSEFRIIRRFWNFLHVYQISYASKSINITGNTREDIAPEMKGAIFGMAVLNFKESSEYVHAQLYFKNAATGYNLNPELSNPLYYRDYTGNKTWDPIAEVGNEGEYLNENSLDYYYVLDFGRIQMTMGLQNETQIPNDKFTPYPSDGEYMNVVHGGLYFAGISYRNDGNHNTFFGTSTYFEDWLESELNEAEDKFEPTYAEPVIDWGASVNYVQQNMSAFDLILGTPGKAEYIDDNFYALVYSGNENVNYFTYAFTESNTGLFMSDIEYATEITHSSLYNELSERFVFMETDEDSDYFLSEDGETFVRLYEYEGTMCVAYYSVAYITNSSPVAAMGQDNDNCLELYKKFAKEHIGKAKIK